MSAITAARAIEVTDPSGYTHLVAEESFTAGHRSGRYIALCDDTVISASLTVESGVLCLRCVENGCR